MPRRKATPEERATVLKLLKRWHEATLVIEEATDRMKANAADPSLGIQSVDYEKARVTAMAVVDAVGREGAEPGFWPELGGRKGPAVLAAFKQKWDEALVCQLNVLRVWGLAAAAFRNKRVTDAPPIQELMSLASELASRLDEIGMLGAALAIHYKIPAKELEKEEEE